VQDWQLVAVVLHKLHLELQFRHYPFETYLAAAHVSTHNPFYANFGTAGFTLPCPIQRSQ